MGLGLFALLLLQRMFLKIIKWLHLPSLFLLGPLRPLNDDPVNIDAPGALPTLPLTLQLLSKYLHV